MEHPEDTLASIPPLETIRTQAEAKAYAESIAKIRAGTKQTRGDLAEGYLTRVDELEQLNALCHAELTAAREELQSLQDLLANCAESNLQFQRQIADLQEQVDGG